MSSVVVMGSAQQLVQPDRVVVGLGLTVVAADAATALDQVSERSVTLGDRLAELGFTSADWVTDGVTVAEEWEYRRDQNTLVGHRASTAITVTIDELDRLPRLLRLAVGDAGAQVRNLSWQVDTAHPVRHELLGRAALDARRRAEAYVSALGLRLGAVELISEAPIAVGPHPADSGSADAPMRLMAAAGARPEMAVSGGQIVLAAEVHVRFAILAHGG
jgi:uncharacterized protein YggE